MTKRSIYIGYEPTQLDALIVARHSLRKHLKSIDIEVRSIVLNDLIDQDLYYRAFHVTCGQMYDHISNAPCSTEFAISRFLTVQLAQTGLALFMDCDMLIRADIHELFDLIDESKAVSCVWHQHDKLEPTKMVNKLQVPYERKNWSSVMLFNCDHPANRKLTTELVNRVPGRDLHRFCWLDDEDIGQIPREWNHLVGYDPQSNDVKIAHFTLGLPSIKEYSGNPLAHEWKATLLDWIR
jgi:lipopolysaccharide biosynthesis glycosyltransferase